MSEEVKAGGTKMTAEFDVTWRDELENELDLSWVGSDGDSGAPVTSSSGLDDDPDFEYLFIHGENVDEDYVDDGQSGADAGEK